MYKLDFADNPYEFLCYLLLGDTVDPNNFPTTCGNWPKFWGDADLLNETDYQPTCHFEAHVNNVIR
jgi:hypothetical protein